MISIHGSYGDPELIVQYELSTHPTALLDNYYLSWEADKPVLADALLKLPGSIPTDISFALDEGALLQRKPFSKEESPCELYVDYVCFKNRRQIEMFDACEDGSSANDGTHQQRRRNGGPNIIPTSQTVVFLKKTAFLAI